MSRATNKIEKRQSKRSFLSEKVTFEVSTHLSLHALNESKSPIKIDSQIKNVSEGGVCLMTTEPLEASQVIKISLPLPHVKITTPTLAEVRWVKKEAGKDHYQAGLRFLL